MEAHNTATEAGPRRTRDREQRKIGTEKFVVRVFREKFIEAAVRAGILRDVLDDFLRTVLTSRDADPTDTKYAKTTYQDAIVRIGGTGLPAWVTEDGSPSPEAAAIVDPTLVATGPTRLPFNTPDPGPRTLHGDTPAPVATQTSLEDDIDALLAAQIPPPPVVLTNPLVALSDADFYDMLQGTEDEFAQFETRPNALTSEDGPLWRIMRDRYAPKMVHPFVEVFEHEGARYAAVGSIYGVVPSGSLQGKDININFTVVPFRSIREVPPDILVRDDHRDGGKVLAITYENPVNPGIKKCLYVLRHRPGLKIRFWTRVAEKDAENGKRFIVLDDSPTGWAEVDRKHF